MCGAGLCERMGGRVIARETIRTYWESKSFQLKKRVRCIPGVAAGGRGKEA